VAPTALQILLTGWNLDPSVVLGLIALGGGYAYAVGPLRERRGWGPPPARGRATAFYLGLAVLAFALLSPLDEIGDRYLFSVHMVQHMLLVMAVPPLLLLGTPGWLLRPLLRRPAVARAGRALTLPLVALVVFNADFWIWHAPPLYDLTLRAEPVHVLEHLTFLVAATLNWFPILSPVPDELPRLPRLTQLLYLFLDCQPMVVLGALLTFAGQPLYLPYVAAPRVFGLTPLADQQLGGLIMWIPGSFVYIVAMSIVFFAWMEQQSAETERREREADAAREAASSAAAGAALADPQAAPPADGATADGAPRTDGVRLVAGEGR
jgi:putative membrane protein